MMNNKIIVQHQQNVEVEKLISKNHNENKKVTSLFDSDPSSFKNDSNRSVSRAADYRLPPLIETSRGRIITNQYTHFHALRICLFPCYPHY
jgi:hypothetical protein